MGGSDALWQFDRPHRPDGTHTSRPRPKWRSPIWGERLEAEVRKSPIWESMRCRRRLNPRENAPESGDFGAKLREWSKNVVVQLVGFEPPIFGSTIRLSSYRCVFLTCQYENC